MAYLRFASVYRAFESADDFEAEIAMLRARARRSTTVTAQPHGLTHRRPGRWWGSCRAGPTNHSRDSRQSTAGHHHEEYEENA